MIRDFTSKQTKKTDGWCRMRVMAPDGRFTGEDIVGGLSYRSAMHEAKQIDPSMLIHIFDSKD